MRLSWEGGGRLFLQAWHDTSFAVLWKESGSMWTVRNLIFPLSLLVSNQVGSPAELKHINKRRKRN